MHSLRKVGKFCHINPGTSSRFAALLKDLWYLSDGIMEVLKEKTFSTKRLRKAKMPMGKIKVNPSRNFWAKLVTKCLYMRKIKRGNTKRIRGWITPQNPRSDPPHRR
jgi:hypothetical protein